MIGQNENHNMVGGNGSYVEMPPAAGLLLESLVQIIWRSRWIVLLATVTVLAAAFAYLAKATPIYTSTSRIYVEQSGPKIFTETQEGVMTQSKNYLYTQAELLKSTPIVSDAVQTLNMRQMKTFAQIDNPVGYLKGSHGLSAIVGKKDDIIGVSFNSSYPAEAAQVVNAVVDSYITYHATRKRSTAGEVLKILQNEKVRRDKELIQKLKAMMDYKKENTGLAFESPRGNVILNMLERLSEAMTQAHLQTLEAKSVYEIMKSMETDPTRLKQFVETEKARGWYSSTTNERSRLMSELDQLQLQSADRGRQVTPDHPSMQALQNKIDQVNKQLDDLDRQFAEAQLAIAEQQYLAAKEKEEHIASYFEEHRQEAIDLNEQLAQYTILQSDWEQDQETLRHS